MTGPSVPPTRRSLLFLAAALVIYGNVVTVITRGELFTSGPAAVTISAVLIVGMMVWSRLWNLPLSELGISRHGAWRGMAVGLAVAAAAAGAALLLLRSGLAASGPVQYAPFAGMSVADVLVRALIWLPIAVALPEELSFRGVLLAMLRRRYSDRQAVALSAVAFAGWHGLSVVHTVGQTSLGLSPASWAVGVLGGFGAVTLGGWIFAELRIRSGNLAASVACHWAFNASVLVGLYMLQR